MARLSYQAPGVYVEEVPSAQQPIAGVGTNTVGFVGVVPDEIQYPEANPDYDPVSAMLALEIAKLSALGGEAAETNEAFFDENIKKLQEDIKARGADKSKTEKDFEKAKNELSQAEDDLKSFEDNPPPDMPEPEKNQKIKEKRKEIENKKASLSALSEQMSKNEGEIEKLKIKIAELQAAKKGEASESKAGTASILRPYILKTFKVNTPPGATKLCTNFSQYKERFGPFSADNPDKPGEAIYPGHRALTHAVNGFFNNGGTRCFVARVRSTNIGEIKDALETFESIDAVAIIAAPGIADQAVWQELVAHCETCEDRFAIFDCPEVVGTEKELDIRALNYDTPDNVLPQRSKNAAFYFPYIEVVDPAKQMQDEDPARNVPLKYRGRLYVPPSGHIAGIYARSDEQRGVHKAPANEAVRGALNVKYYVGKPKHEMLNPQGVNVIRNINGNITVWGARTIGGDRNGEWKYVNVRRLFLFLAESIDEGTQWVVFEPNDMALWGKIKRNVSAFLTNVWRSGALFGASPAEAFYVKCDEETNPPEVRDLGQVVTEIGVAIVRPAEFVIFRITQATGPHT